MKHENIAYTCDGNLALAPSVRQKFVVIDGFVDKKFVPKQNESQSMHTKCTHANKSFVQAMALVLLSSVLISLIAIAVLYVTDIVLPKQAYAQLEGSDTLELTVHSGDSLWQIAEDYSPKNVSTSYTVDYIKTINHLHTSQLMPGQKLLVPKA